MRKFDEPFICMFDLHYNVISIFILKMKYSMLDLHYNVICLELNMEDDEWKNLCLIEVEELLHFCII